MKDNSKAGIRRQLESDYRAKQRAELRAMKAAISKLKRARGSKLGEARAVCSATVKAVRDASRERFALVVAKARALRDEERERARSSCRAGVVALDADEKRALDDAIRILANERHHQASLARWERSAKAREKPKRTGRETKSESDGAVIANLPAELHAVFRKVRKVIKASPRRSRTEAFLEWLEENPGEADAIRFELAEKELSAELRAESKRERARLSPPLRHLHRNDEEAPF